MINRSRLRKLWLPSGSRYASRSPWSSPMRQVIAVAVVGSLLLPVAAAQSRPVQDSVRPASPVVPAGEEKPVVTHHQITIGSRVVKYTVTAGLMPLKNDAGRGRGTGVLHGLHPRRGHRPGQATADVLLQRRARLRLGLAPPRRCSGPGGYACRTRAGCRRRPTSSWTTTQPGSTSPTSSSSTRWAPASAGPPSRSWARSS